MSKKVEDLNNASVAAGSASVAENSILAKDKKGFPFKKVIFGVVIALLVISLILLVINLVINSYFKNILIYDGSYEIDMDKLNSIEKYVNNEEYYLKSEELHMAYHQALKNYAEAMSDMRNDENVYNYAIYGIDKFVESADASADIIMLVSVNTDDDHVTYLAFETRMLVYIPQVGVGPLNDAYILGGPQLLTNAIEQNYGLKINGFVELNMAACSNMIDEFGSIVLSNCDNAKVEKVNEDILLFNAAMHLEGEKEVQPVKLEKGNKINLNGLQALAHMRNAGVDKSNVANAVLSQLTTMIISDGIGGFKTAIDIAIEEMAVYMPRADVGPLITIGLSVLENVNAHPVGNMDGRADVLNGGVTCDYDAERAVIIEKLYTVAE